MKAFIEAVAGSRVRRKYDERTLRETGKRELREAYPFAYGFVLGTRTEDGDALDCFIVSKGDFSPGDTVECEAEEGFVFFEGDEEDVKIFARLAGDGAEYDWRKCRAEVERFLTLVFRDWPEVRVSFGELFGRDEALRVIRESTLP